MNYKSYENYMDSNIEWIGKIPAHWKTNKIKNVSYVKGRIGWHGLTSEEYTDNGAYLVTGTDFSKTNINWNHCNHISYERYNQDPNIHLKEGDLLITKDGTIGKLALIKNIPGKATLNSGIFLVRPTTARYTNEYLYWILFSDIFIRFFDYIKKGSTISHLYQETFERFIFPYPNIEEQKQIANYLDKKTSKIDTSIAKNKELITLLEEKRTALINQVVTKGLNPEVPMKDSGIEWIGEIPEHWKTNKIKNMSYVKGRIGWHGLTSEEYSDEGAYLVTGTDFEEGTVDWNHCNHISYERYKQDPNIHLKEGDLLITKDGTIGKLALIKNIPDKATLNSGIFLVRPLKDNYTNEYLYWILSSDIFTRFFDYIKTGATIAHLYQETFERFFFPYMDINEQNKIVDFLNTHISKINFTIKKVEENINLLEEYKTSLIHHVVTGKIDVRGEKL